MYVMVLVEKQASLKKKKTKQKKKTTNKQSKHIKTALSI